METAERTSLKYRNIAAESAAREPRRVAVLPPELANQIAAGEVVERPASIVKELVENALDAGARRIDITIENGGRDLVRVEDDGCGMRRDDALRALERHATSKIRSVEELFEIATLGFRGEAVPSIGSVSRMEIRTRPKDELAGTRIVVEGGMVTQVEDVGKAPGTSVTVEELFFNTPARLKFLKTAGTESRHITEWLVRIGLSRPDVRFRLTRDGKVRLDMPVAADLKDRVLGVLGRDVYDDLYPTFEFPAVHGITCRGYYSRPGHTQRSATNIYTFVNGRYVSDKTIRAAVKGGYGTMMEKGRFPSVILFVDVPFELVDVNVHPTKTEVRFHDTNSLYRAVYHSIADSLAEAPWLDTQRKAYKLRGDRQYEPGWGAVGPEETSYTAVASDGRQFTPNYKNFSGFAPTTEEFQRGFSSPAASPLPEPPAALFGDAADAHVDAENYFSSLKVIGQFRRMYILCEDASGLVIIDQHAAHERITFERLKAVFRDDHKNTQPLLFPQRIELDAMRADTLEDHLDFFEQAGFEIEPFGGQTFALKSVPAVLSKAKHEKIVKDAVDDFASLGRTTKLDEMMESVLSRMACHGSVRGPTPLSREECESLLRQMDEVDFKANCPHGRPVYFRLGLMQLEESFDRR